MVTTKTTRGAAKTGTTRAKASTAKAASAKSATAKSTTAKSTTAKAVTAKSTAAKSAPRPENVSLVARTGRTIKERPYTSAAIATGAVGVVAAAAAAGAFLVSRRDKSFKEASGELTSKVKDGLASAGETLKDGFASASETLKDGFASASDTVKDLGQRGAEYLKGDGSDSSLASDAGDTSSETRSQREIAEEALTLKETGASGNPAEVLAADQSKVGAISY